MPLSELKVDIPVLAVVAVFTTPEAAINDLPMLLALNRNSNISSEGVSDNESSDSTSESSTSPPPKQAFSLAIDPTTLDPGTIPISASIFNVSAKQPEAIAAVIVGAAFSDVWERIVECCGEAGQRVMWFRTDVEKSKMLGLCGPRKSEDLGRRVKDALEAWVKEGDGERWKGSNLGGVRYF